MATKRISFLGLPLDTEIDADTICKSLRKKNRTNFIAFIDTGSWSLVRRRPEYREALEQMTLCLPGMSEVAGIARLMTGEDCPRVSFDMSTLAGAFFREAVNEEVSIVLIGGAPSTDEDVHTKLRQIYPYLRILSTGHGYGEFEPKVASIMALAPDAVVVSMDQPRQEMFMAALRKGGYKGLAIASKDFFEQFLSLHNYYPSWVNRWHLQFPYRLIHKPITQWGRELVDYVCFWGRAVYAFGKKYYDMWKK